MDKKTITENIERIENISEPGDHEVAELRFKNWPMFLNTFRAKARISRATLYRHAAEETSARKRRNI